MPRKTEPVLVDLLQQALAGMSPAELSQFRRNLAEKLPSFIAETAAQARAGSRKDQTQQERTNGRDKEKS
jgi:hypothetical protein